MIDHSRCFKNNNGLKTDADIPRFSISFVDALKKLEEPVIKERCGKYLTTPEIRAMLKRRDAILEMYEKLYAQHGDTILYP
jgi:hypothetical protein